jgi:hypothetical protein
MNRFERHPDELLSASVSGDLTAAERRELNEHLAVCADCRATLDAYTTQRQLLSGMRQVQPPRDLAPRVRAGIESGRFGAPWWRRPGGIFAAAASLATVGAAAVLAVILVGNLRTGPVASSSSPATSPSAATASESTAATPTPEATPSPTVAPLLQPGETAYLSLSGTLGNSTLTLRRGDAALLTLRAPSGAPVAAALSPDGRWLAWASRAGLKGTDAIWVTSLDGGTTAQLGETLPDPFASHLAWAPGEQALLAYTRLQDPNDPSAGLDAYLYDPASSTATRVTATGSGFAGTFVRSGTARLELWVSVAAADPTSYLLDVSKLLAAGTAAQLPADAVSSAATAFQPIVNGEGTRAIFWRGQMAKAGDGWQFSQGGMPYLTTVTAGVPDVSADAPQPLFDLVAGQNAFASAAIAWGENGDDYAVWNAQWTGISAGPGSFPTQNAVYVGRASSGQPVNAQSDAFQPSAGTIVSAALVDGASGSASTLLVTVQTSAGGEASADAPVATAELHEVTFSPASDAAIGPANAFNGPAVHAKAAG